MAVPFHRMTVEEAMVEIEMALNEEDASVISSLATVCFCILRLEAAIKENTKQSFPTSFHTSMKV